MDRGDRVFFDRPDLLHDLFRMPRVQLVATVRVGDDGYLACVTPFVHDVDESTTMGDLKDSVFLRAAEDYENVDPTAILLMVGPGYFASLAPTSTSTRSQLSSPFRGPATDLYDCTSLPCGHNFATQRPTTWYSILTMGEAIAITWCIRRRWAYIFSKTLPSGYAVSAWQTTFSDMKGRGRVRGRLEGDSSRAHIGRLTDVSCTELICQRRSDDSDAGGDCRGGQCRHQDDRRRRNRFRAGETKDKE